MACRAAQSPQQACGADPESGEHLPHIRPMASASSTDWRQITPTWSRLSPFKKVSTRSYGTQTRPGTTKSAPVPFPWARCGFRSPTQVLPPPDNLALRPVEAGNDRVTTHSRSGARGLLSWRAAQGNIQGFATCWATGMVLRRVLLLAGCILETTLGLRPAERGPTSGTAPRPRPAYARGRLF